MSGTGAQWGLMSVFTDSMTITGRYSDWDQSFELGITWFRGSKATYAGRLQGADSLVGTWSNVSPAATFQRTFFRQPVDP